MITNRTEATGTTHTVLVRSVAMTEKALDRARKADTIAEAVASITKALNERLQHWRRATLIHDSLSQLDDHTLKDIGLHRSTLTEAAWHAADPAQTPEELDAVETDAGETGADTAEEVYAFPKSRGTAPTAVSGERTVSGQRTVTMRPAA